MANDPNRTPIHPQFNRASMALVRPPGKSFIHGISNNQHATVDFDLSLEQHAAYCTTLEGLGLEVITLPVLESFPDSCFVEDTVIITELVSIITRPGHPTRVQEIEDIKEYLKTKSLIIESIKAPGTLDGGDVLRVGSHFYIGRSQRTNQSGAWQISEILSRYGFTSSEVPVKDWLHLKTAVTCVGESILIGQEELAKSFYQHHQEKWIKLDPQENQAANVIRLGDSVIMQSGCPKVENVLTKLGLQITVQDISEFEKKDGSLTCLSVIF